MKAYKALRHLVRIAAFTSVVAGLVIPTIAHACWGPHSRFYVVDGRPGILPESLSLYRVRPAKGEWPKGFRVAAPVEVRLIGDIRGDLKGGRAFLSLPDMRSMCADFAQSDRSTYVVGKARDENGQKFIDVVLLLDSDDVRFKGDIFDVHQVQQQAPK